MQPTPLSGPALIAFLLLDVFLIVALARVLGTLMVKIGQPRVVGEILAGVLLGPTLLGDTLSKTIAPVEVRPLLNGLATLALIMFMFLAGVEYDSSAVKGRVGHATILALLSVLVPALLGFPIARLMHNPAYAGPAGQEFLPFALFIGAALAVTAFPVMAHILMERGELNSRMGSLAVATAGIMSIFMFTYIAFAGAVAADNGFAGLLRQVGYIIAFALVSLFLVRPFLSRILNAQMQGEHLGGNGMAIAFSGMVFYGLIAHVIGIHALVGGFAFGVVLPENAALRRSISGKIYDVAMIFFLPIFFAMAGFSTDLKLLTPDTFLVVALVLLAAIGGKYLGALPARAFGLKWSEVSVVGALVNTRGLLVLVAGLIGLQLEIITILTFTIIVVVALVTNLMTLPTLRFISSRQRPALAPAMQLDELPG